MSAVYPTSVKIFTTKTDKIDLYSSAHMNDVQNEITAIEQIIGTNPGGTLGTLTSRLAVMMDSNGALIGSDDFPTVTYAKQPFYRTDTDVFYIRDSTNTTWGQVGGNITNVVYLDNNIKGAVAQTWNTIWNNGIVFQKVSQMNTLTFRADLFNSTPGEAVILSYYVGGIAGTFSIYGGLSTYPIQVYGTVPVSSLVNGSFYYINGALRGSGALTSIAGTAYVKSLGVFAS